MTKKQVKHPCIKTCGETTRTTACEGRKTLSQFKKEAKK